VEWGEKKKRSMVGGFWSVYGCLPNLLSRQNKNQPEREFLENGRNSEIRKIRNNAQNQNSQRSRQMWKNKRRSEKTKPKAKMFKQTPGEEAHKKVAFQMGNQCGRRQPTGRAKQLLAVWEWVGYGVMQCCASMW